MIAALMLLAAAPQTQLELDRRASAGFARADVEMNAQYRATMTAMRKWDARPAGPGYANALLKAQRAWLIYRDAECVAEGYRYFGGSMQSLATIDCKARLTRARTGELKAMTEEGK